MLLWNRGPLLLRLEGDVTRDEALELARVGRLGNQRPAGGVFAVSLVSEVRMKKLLLVLAVAVVAVPLANAGGWATVGLSSLPPTGLKADQPWPVDITVLQHGQTPLAGVTPVLRDPRRQRQGRRDVHRQADGEDRRLPHRRHVPGLGHVSLRGLRRFRTYGGAKTHTFKAVTIASPGGGSFPYLPVGIAAALALAAAAFLLVRRTRPLAEPATVTRIEEAA